MSPAIVLPAPSQDYPPAMWMPADPSNYHRGRPVPTYDRVIIHITDGHERAQSTAEMWAKPKDRPSSAHFVIGQDGTIVQCVSLADTAWHAHAVNGRSVGIEHCARSRHELGPQDPGLPVSEAQYQASARLVAWLCRRVEMQPTRAVILGHAEVDSSTTHADCPTGALDWARLMSAISSAVAEWDSAS